MSHEEDWAFIHEVDIRDIQTLQAYNKELKETLEQAKKDVLECTNALKTANQEILIFQHVKEELAANQADNDVLKEELAKKSELLKRAEEHLINYLKMVEEMNPYAGLLLEDIEALKGEHSNDPKGHD